MRIDRLLSILTILLQVEQITAPELARRLEVSRRTITRDIDTLCQAGIPIVTRQGGGGGISIAPGYKLDKSLLTRGELENIRIGLGSLHTVSTAGKLAPLVEKLASLHPQDRGRDSVLIDLSSHYRESLSAKIDLLRRAIRLEHTVAFTYYSPTGKTKRRVEPCHVIFHWSDWYLLGYCLLRRDFRLFKLVRLWDLVVESDLFSPRAVPEDKLDLDAYLTDQLPVELLLSPQAEYRLVEEYGPECYQVLADGRLHFRGSYTNRNSIMEWILGFGSLAEVLSPDTLRREIQEELARAAAVYREGD